MGSTTFEAKVQPPWVLEGQRLSFNWQLWQTGRGLSFPNSQQLYLQVKEIFILIGVKLQKIGVILVVDFTEVRIEGEQNEVDFFEVGVTVDPAHMVLALAVLDGCWGTVKKVSLPLSLLTLTFLVVWSWWKRPALTSYLGYSWLIYSLNVDSIWVHNETIHQKASFDLGLLYLQLLLLARDLSPDYSACLVQHLESLLGRLSLGCHFWRLR